MAVNYHFNPSPLSISTVGERIATRMFLEALLEFFTRALCKLGVEEFGYSESDCRRVLKETIIGSISKLEIKASNLGEDVDPATATEDIRDCAIAYVEVLFATRQNDARATN